MLKTYDILCAARSRRPAACRVPETLGLCVVLAIAATSRADNPLRYRLAAGLQLVYDYHATTMPLDHDEPARRAAAEIELWSLQERGGESLILVDLARVDDGRAEPLSGALLYVDTTGRRQLPEAVAARLDSLDPALDLLPMLPVGGESNTVWATPPDRFQRRWRCTSQGPDSTHGGHVRVDFALEDPTGVSALQGCTRSGRFWFDPEAGCVSRFEAEEVDRGRPTRTQVSAVLRQTLTRPSAWLTRRVDESDRFLRALRHEDRLLADVVLRPSEVVQTLQQLDQLWTAFKTDVEARTGSPFLRLADARRQQLRSDAALLRARATLGLRWMNQPARPWSLQDPTGRTVTSESQRPGVALECFWSADSVASLRALESFRRLQTDPAPDPVRVLCYNMDDDPLLADRAVKSCGRGLTLILGGPLQQVEALPEFPVVRVVDRAGRIRGVWIGWQPDYPAARELAHKLMDETSR